jgi:hypothetical protein
MSGSLTNESRKWMESRCSRRVSLHIPVQARWKPEAQEPISEDTNTLVVNAHGALIALAMRVRVGSHVLLRNCNTARNQECRGVHVREMPHGKNEVGIAFPVQSKRRVIRAHRFSRGTLAVSTHSCGLGGDSTATRSTDSALP